jgi:hypothetical protein
MHFSNFTDTKRISQFFQDFKNTDLLEVSAIFKSGFYPEKWQPSTVWA